MQALYLDSLNADQLCKLDDLYPTTRAVWVRTRAQMILLVADQGLTVSEVAAIVRERGETISVGSIATKPRASTASSTRRAQASRPRSEPPVASGWSKGCMGARALWILRP